MSDAAGKDESPNKDIDKALKRLMKALEPRRGDDAEPLAPDEVRAHVAVVATAIKWEQVKHNIKDGDDWNPSAI